MQKRYIQTNLDEYVEVSVRTHNERSSQELEVDESGGGDDHDYVSIGENIGKLEISEWSEEKCICVKIVKRVVEIICAGSNVRR